MDPHSYWVFPILAEEPERVIAGLRRAGFDATQGQSMCAVAPPPDRPERAPHNAANALAKIVFLPNYPELPEPAARKMAEVVLRTAEKPAFLANGGPRASPAPARLISGSPATER
jgi:dTDP-4-amino-4,6-dideoxygalactose transaminase